MTGVVRWRRLGVQFAATPVPGHDVKADRRLPGGEWQPRDWHGKWVRVGYRVRVAGVGRIGTVHRVDGPGIVTVTWDDGAQTQIGSSRLRVVGKPGVAARPPSPARYPVPAPEATPDGADTYFARDGGTSDAWLRREDGGIAGYIRYNTADPNSISRYEIGRGGDPLDGNAWWEQVEALRLAERQPPPVKLLPPPRRTPPPVEDLPDIDDLVPQFDTNFEDDGDQHEENAHRVLSDLLPGLEFAGFTLGELTWVDAQFEPDPDDPDGEFMSAPYSLAWSVPIFRGSEKVGLTTRMFGRDMDSGNLYVEHKVLQFDNASDQGNGFAPAWNSWLEKWYRANDLERIQVNTGYDIGGYAWARFGFGFADERSFLHIMDRLSHQIEEYKQWLADTENDPDVTDAEYHARVAELNEALQLIRDGVSALMRWRASDAEWDEELLPSAYRFSQVGRRSADQDPKTDPWIGAKAMFGSQWRGRKWLR
ncbi:hypothetical protein GCM10022252_75520 [Streptosporangium oxazolinicum]|uniref:Uncharacterized protein n=1 Tax=Streptosporangium oxazolinicum TaxID=909287 RepID=A0ABP8BKY6_9ACTN